ncbi:MAG TPA: 3'-5' exonuclease [Pseudobacteroides sp.]|nr:3'-5' exonuclease [Pseudobacteroides sp.]
MNYIIFDLEATCWDNDKSKTSEIIEIGAVKLNEKLEVTGTFCRFIKPTINPVLSEFCTELTTIKQEDVNEAKAFNDIIKEFEEWIISDNLDVVLCSWGFYDKKQIKTECELKG